MSYQKKTPNNKRRPRNNRPNSNNKQVVSHLQQKQNIKELERLKMAKRGEQKTIKVEGIEYLLQHPGLLESIRMRDRSKNDIGTLIEELTYREMLDHVIFLKDGSKVDFEYFEENPGFADVMKEAMEFVFK